MTLYVNGLDDSAPPRLDAGERPLAHGDPVTIGGSAVGDAAGAAGRIGHAHNTPRMAVAGRRGAETPFASV